jgi:capsular exopolysaccharide synthesis family protein
MDVRSQTSGGGDSGFDVFGYLTVLRRHARLVVGLALLGLTLAVVYSGTRHAEFTAHAEILLRSPVETSPTTRLSDIISVETEARLVASAPIARAAKAALGSPLTVHDILDRVAIETSPDTFVLDVRYSAHDPRAAAAGANAFARAYLDYRRQQAIAEITQQRTVIEQQMAQLRDEERQQTDILADSRQGSSEYSAAQDALDRISFQIAALASQLGQIPPVGDAGEVILPATPPSSPSSPRYTMNAAAGLFLGFFVGVVLAFAIDRSDDRIRDRSDVAAYVRAPILTYVPHERPRHRDAPLRVIVETEPRSPSAEAYSTARTSLLALARRDDARVIAVASALPREGKTTTTANLAASLARADVRVLIVSADLRKPRVAEYFGITAGTGLAGVLEGRFSLDEAIVDAGVRNVWIVPAGTVPPHPAELLQSGRLGDVLAEARRSFDVVLVDCPPILGLSDCLSILPLADAVVMVVRADESPGPAVADAVDVVHRAGASISGVVLNDVRVSRGHRSSLYGYYVARYEQEGSGGEFPAPEPRPAAPTAPRKQAPTAEPRREGVAAEPRSQAPTAEPRREGVAAEPRSQAPTAEPRREARGDVWQPRPPAWQAAPAVGGDGETRPSAATPEVAGNGKPEATESPVEDATLRPPPTNRKSRSRSRQAAKRRPQQ